MRLVERVTFSGTPDTSQAPQSNVMLQRIVRLRGIDAQRSAPMAALPLDDE